MKRETSSDLEKIKSELVETNIKTKSRGSLRFILILIILGLFLASIIVIKNNQNRVAHNRIISQNLVTSGSGLYKDDVLTGYNENLPFSSKYYFKGNDVNNYILISNMCFRIISISQNNTIKIIYNGITTNQTCETVNLDSKSISFSMTNDNDWLTSEIKKTLENWVSNNKIFDNNIDLTSSNSIVASADWYIGGVKFSGNKLIDNIEDERTTDIEKYNSKIGLISISEYSKAGCQKSVYDAIAACGDDNYLHNNTDYWTLTKTLGGNQHVWAIKDGMTSSILTTNQNYLFYPVLYLKENLKLNGNGTKAKPYMVVNQ